MITIVDDSGPKTLRQTIREELVIRSVLVFFGVVLIYVVLFGMIQIVPDGDAVLGIIIGTILGLAIMLPVTAWRSRYPRLRARALREANPDALVWWVAPGRSLPQRLEPHTGIRLRERSALSGLTLVASRGSLQLWHGKRRGNHKIYEVGRRDIVKIESRFVVAQRMRHHGVVFTIETRDEQPPLVIELYGMQDVLATHLSREANTAFVRELKQALGRRPRAPRRPDTPIAPESV
ncbi:hypothetical protein [Mycetocola saprophilus]|uniref:hypothetical protein n=1 Tax=Mycetocola saprophilus TaxID=76636 RepID=UPI003BF1A5EA